MCVLLSLLQLLGEEDAREADDESQGPPLGLGNIDRPHIKKNESTVSLRLLWSMPLQTPYPRARVYTLHSSMLPPHSPFPGRWSWKGERIMRE